MSVPPESGWVWERVISRLVRPEEGAAGFPGREGRPLHPEKKEAVGGLDLVLDQAPWRGAGTAVKLKACLVLLENQAVTVRVQG